MPAPNHTASALTVLVAIASLSSCQAPSVVNLAPHFQAAVNAEQLIATRYAFEGEVDPARMPPLIMAASTAVDTQLGVDRVVLAARCAKRLSDLIPEFGPDLVLFREPQIYLAGTVNHSMTSAFVGGLSGGLTATAITTTTSSSIYRQSMTAEVYRIPPVDLGFRARADATVIRVLHGTAADSAGIIPGDILLSVAGIVIPMGASLQGLVTPQRDEASLEGAILRFVPGDDVEFVFIRPGAGEIRGTGVATASDVGAWMPLLSNRKPLRITAAHDDEGRLTLDDDF